MELVPCVVRWLRRAGSSPDSLFHVTRFPVRVPAAQRDAFNQLTPGEATIEVSFTAQGTDARVGVLSIETDVAAQPQLVVNLRGSGL